MPAEILRVFYAVALPVDARRQIAEYVAGLQSRYPTDRISWIHSGNLHITLKFVGGVCFSRIAGLKRIAHEAVQDISPFELTIEGSGAFPERGPARILWVGVTDHSRSLSIMQARIEQACHLEGFLGEERPFHAHVTIARIRQPNKMDRLMLQDRAASLAPVSFTIDKVALMRSEPGSSGSHYSTISLEPFVSSRSS